MTSKELASISLEELREYCEKAAGKVAKAQRHLRDCIMISTANGDESKEDIKKLKEHCENLCVDLARAQWHLRYRTMLESINRH